MKDLLFSGVCTALVTPFLGNEINYPMAQQLLRRQIDAGIHSVVLSGTTGEAPTLSDNEKLELLRRCKSYAGNSCKLITGTGSNSTEHAIRRSVDAENAGADALLVVSPYYNKATPDGLIKHYEVIATSVSIPIIVYNVPSRTGVDIPVSVYQELSKIKNIAGIKEASQDITKITKIRHECGDLLPIWCGNDDQTVPVIALGGHGVISVLSNICPKETAAMTNAALTGDFITASALQCQLLPLIELLFCEVNPIPVKAAMNYIGYDCGECRMPLCALSEKSRMRLNHFFKNI